MTLPVVIGDNASSQFTAAYHWWRQNRSAEQAERWFDEFLAAIKAIAQNPHRYAVLSDSERFLFEVRELRFGLGHRPTHRALFTIRPDMIYVFSIRHVAQGPVGPDDI